MEKINTRQLLLEVSERVFAESGFEGASTRRITVEAGVNIATIKYYYGSKELLYAAIFNYRIAELNTALASRLKNNTAGTVKKLNTFIDEYAKLLKVNIYFLRLLHRELCSFNKSSLKTSIITDLTKNSKMLYKLIEQGIAGKVFRKVNLPMAVLTVFSLLFQIVAGTPIAESMLQYEKFDIDWQERVEDLKGFILSILKV